MKSDIVSFPKNFATPSEVVKLLCDRASSSLSHKGNPVRFTPQVLQKLVFICNGISLALNDKALLSAPVLIGRDGPYFEDLSPLINHDIDRIDSKCDFVRKLTSPDVTEGIMQLVGDIYTVYVEEQNLSCEDLDYLTLGNKTDWNKIYFHAEKQQDFILPNEIIKKRFLDDMNTDDYTSYDLPKITDQVG